MSLKRATVISILETREDLQKVRVELEESKELLLAYNYLALGPSIAREQSVLVNTLGIDFGLGTGGAVFVVPQEFEKPVPESRLRSPDLESNKRDSAPSTNNFEHNSREIKSALQAQTTSSQQSPDQTKRGYGHIVKLRYTPLQIALDSVEEQDSPFHELLKNARSIEGMPVVCCELHSQMPLVAAAIKHENADARVSYLMNDVAALPLAFSELVYQTKEAGFIDQTITAGQAFGGDLEAISLHSALLAAALVANTDIAIVAPGPGIVGSGTAFGHSGIAQGEALNAVAALQGNPIASLRLSWKDARARHRGLSHHSKTVLSQVCLTSVAAPLPRGPQGLSSTHYAELIDSLDNLNLTQEHHFAEVEASFDAIDLGALHVHTMGRTRKDDPDFFNAAFAAGIYAARLQKPESGKRSISSSQHKLV